MHDRNYWLRHIDASVGDTVYYVTGDVPVYSIRKTRIVEAGSRHLSFDRHFGLDYTVYKTADGAIISREVRNRKDELDPEQVFFSKADAARYIVELLRREINRQKHTLLDAQERLAAAERVLNNYQKYLKDNE